MTIRKFSYTKDGKVVNLVDIDPTKSPDEIRKMYAPKHPDLLAAGVVEKGAGSYEFAVKVGKRG